MKIGDLTAAQVKRFAHELVDASVRFDNDALDHVVADLDLSDEPTHVANGERAIVAQYERLHDPRRIQDLYERVERRLQLAIERQPAPELPQPPGPPPPKPTRNNVPSVQTALLALFVPIGGAFIWEKERRDREVNFRHSYESWLKELDAKAAEWKEHNSTVKSLVEGALHSALEEGTADANSELQIG